MPRVVMISNRVPDPRRAGGVAVAIGAAMGGENRGIWMGWSGEVAETPTTSTRQEPVGTIITTDLSPDEHRNFYLGYANSVLWPTFHNRVDLAMFEAGFFAAYAAVNRRFAELIAPLIEDGDLVWIHDYQFILLGSYLRELGVTNRIGFFLHIPFPPTCAFFALPEYALIAAAFAAYDLIGLQTSFDVATLMGTLEDAVNARLLPDGRMRVGEREVAVGSFPIGIDFEAFKKHSSQAIIAPDFGSALRIVGVDRLDYTKGLPQKFRAFGRFLKGNPSYHRRVTLTQIAAPTRESVEAYSDIRSELETLCGAINGRYGDLDWVPIRYINRTVPRDGLTAVYRGARVGLVTPMCDGMNLVAKEFVAAQDEADPGVLILSRFAGAAEEMRDAVIVNPYDIDGVATAIRSALEMPVAERRVRHERLLATISSNDAAAWATKFLGALQQLRSLELAPASSAIRRSLERLRAGQAAQ